MKPARRQACLTAWVLCLSIFCAALGCASSHGRTFALQVAGLAAGEGHCAHGGHAAPAAAETHAAHASASPASFGGSGCVLGSLFGATLLAAFFGLFGLLSNLVMRPPLSPGLPRLPRYRWPAANPRASPFQSFTC